MALPEKKKGLASIFDVIKGGKPKGEAAEAPPSRPALDDGTDEPLDDKADAMQDLKEAFDSGDYSAAALAFQRAYEICAEKSDDSDDAGDEGESRY